MASLEAALFDANGLGLGWVNTPRDEAVGDHHALAFGDKLGGVLGLPTHWPVSVTRSRSGQWRPNPKTPVTLLVDVAYWLLCSPGQNLSSDVARTLYVFDRPVEPAEIIAAFLMER
jgi:hypothetical protein